MPGDRLAARRHECSIYHVQMKRFNPFARHMSDEAFDAYLQICHEIYLEMLNTGQWPWKEDSPNTEDLVESEDS